MADIWENLRISLDLRTIDSYPPPVLDLDSGCLRWQGPNTDPWDRTGYGYISGGKTQKRAHVAIWEARYGDVPIGMVLDHVFDRGCIWKDCVNLDHLEPVTPSENTRRGAKSRWFRRKQREEMYRTMRENGRI